MRGGAKFQTENVSRFVQNVNGATITASHQSRPTISRSVITLMTISTGIRDEKYRTSAVSMARGDCGDAKSIATIATNAATIARIRNWFRFQIATGIDK